MIIHICLQKDWKYAQDLGEYQADSLETEGFIHCSKPEQVLRVANGYFPTAQDLLLLWIDPGKLEFELRWEASDGDVYPHIYGPLNLDAVIAVREYLPDPDGVFRVLPTI